MRSDGLKITRKEDVILFVPQSLLGRWDGTFAKQDFLNALPQISLAINEIHSLHAAGHSEPRRVREILRQHVRNQQLFETDLGRYIQIQVLTGHSINATRFFRGSHAVWNGKATMTLKNVEYKGETDRQGRPLFLATVTYWDKSYSVTQATDDLLSLLYPTDNV